MNRRVYLIIIYVITALIVLGVLFYRVGKFAWGCGKALADSEDGRSFVESMMDDGNYEKTDVSKTIDGKIAKLDIRANVSTLTFVESDEWKVTYSGLKRLEPTIDASGKTLTVKQPSNNGLNIGNNSGKIVIYFPKDTELESLKIEANVGEVLVENISVEKIEFETNVGEAVFRNVTFKDGEFETNVGEMELDKVTFEKLDVSGNVGEIDILAIGSPRNCKFELSASLGELRVNGETYGRKYKQDASDKQTMYIIGETSIGDLSIDFLEK